MPVKPVSDENCGRSQWIDLIGLLISALVIHDETLKL